MKIKIRLMAAMLSAAVFAAAAVGCAEERSLSGTGSEAESETESECASESASETESEAESESESEKESEATSEPESESESEPGAAELTSKGFPIEVRDGITYVGGVLIANKKYALPAAHAPGDLLPEVWDAFYRLQTAASLDGCLITFMSGYRSYADQNWIYNSYVAVNGQALTDTFSARPGHSEHQSGYAVDVCNTESWFAASPEGLWLAEHAWEYGFIIRYPLGKEDITGYKYEPWHLRYVGDSLAEAIEKSGLCLEEYFGIEGGGYR